MPSLIVANDIVGLGKVALTISLPIISTCQTEVIPLPTVLLSSHTGGFNSVHVRDLSDDLLGFIKQWDELKITASGLVTGYFKSSQQIEIVRHFAEAADLPLFVDPIMGDRGKLYQGFDETYVEAMKSFCRKAEVIIPNLTEAALLTDTKFLEEGTYRQVDIENLLTALSQLGPEQIIITGVSFSEDEIGLAYLDSRTGTVSYVMTRKFPNHFFGTGDVLTSILAAGFSWGLTFEKVAPLALSFLDKVLETTLNRQRDLKLGLSYESHLGKLFMDFKKVVEDEK